MMLQYALEREVTEAFWSKRYYENAPATTKEKGRLRTGMSRIQDSRHVTRER